MQTAVEPAGSKLMTRAGYVASALIVLFMLMDGVMKVLELQVSVEPTAALGYPETSVRGLGILLLLCTALYAWPRTAVLGAILLTAYLGGAVAAHFRVGSPPLGYTMFGVYLGLILWAGLFLRDPRVRALLPIRR
jgi:DoxX-like family